MENLTIEQERQVDEGLAREVLERLGLDPTEDRKTRLAKLIQEFEQAENAPLGS
ncbi:MAG: hypothetical protein K2Q33_08805 [Gammaproteobacteria bacterium]|nr:hypothetical protein [Gammaproteobacteria bacterium]